MMKYKDHILPRLHPIQPMREKQVIRANQVQAMQYHWTSSFFFFPFICMGVKVGLRAPRLIPRNLN